MENVCAQRTRPSPLRTPPSPFAFVFQSSAISLFNIPAPSAAPRMRASPRPRRLCVYLVRLNSVFPLSASSMSSASSLSSCPSSMNDVRRLELQLQAAHPFPNARRQHAQQLSPPLPPRAPPSSELSPSSITTNDLVCNQSFSLT